VLKIFLKKKDSYLLKIKKSTINQNTDAETRKDFFEMRGEGASC
jgi:hypothetical protein